MVRNSDSGVKKEKSNNRKDTNLLRDDYVPFRQESGKSCIYF